MRVRFIADKQIDLVEEVKTHAKLRETCCIMFFDSK